MTPMMTKASNLLLSVCRHETPSRDGHHLPTIYRTQEATPPASPCRLLNTGTWTRKLSWQTMNPPDSFRSRHSTAQDSVHRFPRPPPWQGDGIFSSDFQGPSSSPSPSSYVNIRLKGALTCDHCHPQLLSLRQHHHGMQTGTSYLPDLREARSASLLHPKTFLTASCSSSHPTLPPQDGSLPTSSCLLPTPSSSSTSREALSSSAKCTRASVSLSPAPRSFLSV